MAQKTRPGSGCIPVCITRLRATFTSAERGKSDVGYVFKRKRGKTNPRNLRRKREREMGGYHPPPFSSSTGKKNKKTNKKQKNFSDCEGRGGVMSL